MATVDELTVDELYELPGKMTGLSWFALCRLVALGDLPRDRRGWSGAKCYGGATQEWEYDGRLYLEIGTSTFYALKRRGLAREKPDGAAEATLKGIALVEGQGFRIAPS